MLFRLYKFIKLKLKYIKYNTYIKTPNIGEGFKCGKFCLINKGTYIGNNVTLGNFTYTNSSSSNILIEDNVKIGSFCSIAPGVIIAPGNHYLDFITTHPILYNEFYMNKIHYKFQLKANGLKDDNITTIIGNDVWIGINSIIKRGVKIGNGAVIASGSIITKDVEDYSIVGGNPAKHIKYRFSPEEISFLKVNKKIWEFTEDELVEYLPYLYNINDYMRFLNNRET